ncbi:MAG TPA: tRNA (N(6)-L-threonylcarbamoyladenosine(37)-C(2))-methylthiotransferase MtaB [Hungateiclostridium thermocellum]|jgi:threonylcarbamoyladenosine tRNA methylthiotransferase MtaB|uniref:Threonylcarbamoyladenosine tRNA methylthiotransferase MtaB n=2 Tax=Acetivibrio thermocellus TaxID=1515 RepID=A3DBR2_ACET2|nr:tRNA (N(6)-L-threonylcarbamoyladenosine(37)-C(2))-methylthiotransferase MtaB [Acetivibrio thermocellus]CDG34830.1 Threonylcarbamoyladenosine tRNA methylthiotransferase MtaB [Acetivibrio thermocellus BC1]ABN51391.1 RNA modification enzyme, MiaB family [Acetivibrio thermocellus ATCC 27405]ADU75124.1 RNA modification enzyme, MiaB family [Acetivibrio thermocellus DSM 1313]ALX09099.1 MiaB-like tRNA modifying enzyme [Acetivibrio thermocellus AD2]ANV76851.1 MiaB-like tRNA modifying enzyme [Acetivi
MKRAAFYTLGCKVNQYETEAISEMFEKAGYKIVDFEDEADVYVINTCTVTNLSDRKSRQMIRRAKRNNENSIVIVIGCYAQTAPEEVSKIEGVNLVVGTKDRSRILEYLKELETSGGRRNYVGDIMKTREFEELGVNVYKERTRAFIKIQEGCNQFCTYCIIPYARGPVRSRSEENILKEVSGLAHSGYKEVVLTGIHVASYGKDIKNTSLIDIIRKVHEIEGIERIRLGSIEPTTVTEEFVRAIKGMEKLCPQFHISLQSGCDSTLKRMNRKYTTKEYLRSVELLRENLKDVAVTTDVMVGFPGETDEEFNETCRFVEKVLFARMHVFKYSRRKGTPAASYPDQVAPQKKEERSRILIELASRMTLEYNKSFTGRVLPVLFEQEVKGKEGFMEGLTPNYIRVECKGDKDIEGQILNVLLREAKDDYIVGEIVN